VLALSYRAVQAGKIRYPDHRLNVSIVIIVTISLLGGHAMGSEGQNLKVLMLQAWCLVLFLQAGLVLADSREEIDHLLDYVAKSNCKYDRNGTIHDGPQARDHMNRKYQYYRKKVKTAEDFIEYSATRSTISGKEYKIRCPETGVTSSSDWLLDELRRYRQERRG
jgi:hypothetical protein